MTTTLATQNFIEKTNAEHSSDSIPLWRRRFVFSIIVYLQIMSNFDSGVLAAILGGDALKKSKALEGWLASSVYLGHIVGCVITGSVLNHWMLQYRIKYVLSVAMILNAGCIFAFVSFTYFASMFVARMLSGVTASMLVVYAPLWVDDYAPAARVTTWMSILQAAVPVGIMLGYVTSGMLLANTSFSWEYSFYLQCVCICPAALAILCVSNRNVNLQHVIVVVAPTAGQHTEYGGISEAAPNNSFTPQQQRFHNNSSINSVAQFHPTGPSTFAQVKTILRNPLYLATVCALSSLYFVVTGLQLWATAYLTAPQPIHAPLVDVVAAFGIACITGPTVGVILGGIIMDVSGGYSGNMVGATTIGALCGTLAVACSVAAIQMTTLYGFIIFVWLVLFAGGAVVPITTGLNIACVPKECRNVSCSVAAIVYNLFGYFLGPLVCGMAEDIQLGMTIVLYWSGVSWVSILFACFVVRRQTSGTVGEEEPTSGGGPEGETPETASLYSEHVPNPLKQSLAVLLQQPVSAYEVRKGMTQAEASAMVQRLDSGDVVHPDLESSMDSGSEVVRKVSLERPVRVVSLVPGQSTRSHASFNVATDPQRRGTVTNQNRAVTPEPRSRTGTVPIPVRSPKPSPTQPNQT